MFRSRSTNRRRRKSSSQRARLGRGLWRRLGVESMEGRLMLATTAVGFEPVELPLTTVTASAQDYVITSKPAVWVTQLNEEGGFITNRYSWDDATNGGAFLLGNTIGNTFSSDTLNELIQYNSVGTPGVPGTTRGWLLVNELATDTGGIKPVVVVVAESNADVSAALDPILSQYNNTFVDSDEGGSIPIETILANPELESGPGPDQPVRLASLAEENVNDSAPNNNLAAVRDDDAGVAGEWARAMVFELAGGEPDQDGAAAAKDLDLLDGGPLSSIRTQRDADRETAERPRAPHVPEAAMAMVSATVPAAGASTLVGAMLGGFSSMFGNASVAGESDSAQPAGNSHVADDRDGAGQDVASMPVAIIESAFEEIGSGAQSVFQSLAGESWRRSFGAAPFLMVLALERIAASNSRRANRDAVSVAVRRPKLDRSHELPERS